MSKKQLGAAPGEGNEPQTGERRGWVGRLRAQPGFRTASIAFVLTVVLGIGSTAAYAYWSQRNTVTQTVTTVRQPLPSITGKTECKQFGFEAATIKFTPVVPTQLPADARILVSVSIPDKKLEKLYLVPNTGSFLLRDLPGLNDAIGTSFGRQIFISVTSAYVSNPLVALPATVGDKEIVLRALPPAQGAQAVFVASYFC